MRRFRWLSVAVILTIPALAHADEFWRGWCAGRRAGLEQASTVVHRLIGQVRDTYKDQPEVVEKIDLFLAIDPLVSFGPPLDRPFIAEHESGQQVQCPSGEVVRPAPEHRKG